MLFRSHGERREHERNHSADEDAGDNHGVGKRQAERRERMVHRGLIGYEQRDSRKTQYLIIIHFFILFLKVLGKNII